MENLEFYRHLFDETLFLVPEKQDPHYQQPLTAAVVAQPMDAGDTRSAPAYSLLGENRKGLIIVVSLPEQAFGALPQNEFLTRVLAAIQRSPADVAFVNIAAGEKLQVHQLSRQTQVNHLVAFGSGLLDMSAGSNVGLYKPASIGQVPLLVADPLAAVEGDVAKKKLLWAGLQAIFLK